MVSGEVYWARMRSLGNLRCRILLCLGAENPRRPAFFSPDAHDVLADALHSHLLRLYDLFLEDREGRKIVAAGLLTFGDLPRAGEILEALPTAPIVTDHGAGWCALVAYTTLAALIPLPPAYNDPKSWVAGTAIADGLQHWFEQQRALLRWDRTLERFLLK